MSDKEGQSHLLISRVLEFWMSQSTAKPMPEASLERGWGDFSSHGIWRPMQVLR